MKKVILTKISDSGGLPYGIAIGQKKTGIEIESPIEGEIYCVNDFCTSPIIKIIDENTFKTFNSTYKIEYET